VPEKEANVEPLTSLTIEVRDKDGNLKHLETIEAKKTLNVAPWKRP
jgi:hypothetical protein